jgi:hypothetical protein
MSITGSVTPIEFVGGPVCGRRHSVSKVRPFFGFGEPDSAFGLHQYDYERVMPDGTVIYVLAWSQNADDWDDHGAEEYNPLLDSWMDGSW